MIFACLILAASAVAAVCSAVRLAGELHETWALNREIARLRAIWGAERCPR